VAAVEEKTIRRQSTARIASRRASEPPTLVCQYSSGVTWLAPTRLLAAKCSTASGRTSASTGAESCSEARTSDAPSGTASAWPVDRSSSTVTR
jgi:hypothetical protein